LKILPSGAEEADVLRILKQDYEVTSAYKGHAISTAAEKAD
jgi:hypothetical protein